MNRAKAKIVADLIRLDTARQRQTHHADEYIVSLSPSDCRTALVPAGWEELRRKRLKLYRRAVSSAIVDYPEFGDHASTMPWDEHFPGEVAPRHILPGNSIEIR